LVESGSLPPSDVSSDCQARQQEEQEEQDHAARDEHHEAGIREGREQLAPQLALFGQVGDEALHRVIQ
jgi:hypothetical protein